MDFINGKPDPWGMKVNPATRRSSCRARSGRCSTTTSRRPTNTCRQDNPTVYFTQLAAPVTTLRKVAEALLDALAQRADPLRLRPGHATPTSWAGSTGSPTAPASCSAWSASATPQRYGLRTAALQTKEGHLRRARPTGSLGGGRATWPTAEGRGRPPFVLDQADVRKSGTAYPGTMVVYTAARLRTSTRTTPTRSRSSSGPRPPRARRPAPATASCRRLPADREDGRRRPSSTTPPRRSATAVEAQTPAPSEGRRPRRSDSRRPDPAAARPPDASGGRGTRPAGRADGRLTAAATADAPRRRRAGPPAAPGRCRRPRRSAPTWATGRCRCCWSSGCDRPGGAGGPSSRSRGTGP